ncbi:MAG: TIGR02757 family protein [Deltaproteobacteria bacterium]|nr:TIGR02757 family protein [Deltaproteobacteria bacterium]
MHAALEGVLARCDVGARVATDPVELVRRHHDRRPRDLEGVEIVALIASSVAFGNVTALRAKLADALARLGPSPAQVADDAIEVRRRLSGWKHRVWIDDDLARMIIGARAVQRAHGTLGDRFAGDLAAHGDFREALASFVDAIRAAGGLDRVRRQSARHLLPDPRGASACKRLLLFLRWMVRGPDGADLGLWRDRVDRSRLLVPVDVHIHKLARNLALTERATASWATAEEITASLRRIDPRDPVRFDFALCHMGMAQRCPSRRDPVRCEGCGVKPACRHWAPRRAR